MGKTIEGSQQCCAGRKDFSRRQFLSFAGWGIFFATIAAALISLIRFLFPIVIFEPSATFKIGKPDDFKTMEKANKHGVIFVSETWKEAHRVWVVREDKRIYAIFGKCTHLGCTPNWFPEEGVFKCPCHGSEYYSNGVNFAGPAPRPMDRFKVSIADDGQIMVDKSVLFIHKDFDNPNAYIEV